MNNIMKKLRVYNKQHYYIMVFSLFISVLLVTSYALIYYSPTVQSILPQGGDSRKQADLIFAIAILGCAVFTTYASSLFYKYKSGEFGVFMALGIKKRFLKKILYREISLIAAGSALAGLIISIPVSWCIWKLFQIVIIDTEEMTYSLGWYGFGIGCLFSLFAAICVFFLGSKFIKNSDIITLIRETKTSETIKRVKPWLGPLGILLIIAGMFLGYIAPIISVRIWGQYLPSFWNATYLLTLIGIYFFMVRIVAGQKKGKTPKRYYQNIISVNMMRFTGKQTVRNMCVITFLIAGSLFATFYTPTMATGVFYSSNSNPVDYTFFYPETESLLSKDDIYALAAEYNVNITSYYEISSLSLLRDGIAKEYDEEENKLTEHYENIYGYGQFFAVSDFNKVSGANISVDPGTYKILCYPGQEEGIFSDFDDISHIIDPQNGGVKNLSYSGRADFMPLSENHSINYILSDEDYNAYKDKTSQEYRTRYVLFNVKDPKEQYNFARSLKNKIITAASPAMAIPDGYDRYSKEQADAKGETYFLDDEEYKIDLYPDNNQLALDWKYYPLFTVLETQDLLKNASVYIMLFVYISLICYIAVAVMAYTRSVTIGINNKQLFNDIRRLGASENYILKVIKKQLSKIFLYPTATAAGVIYLFYCLIMYNNDSNISVSEILALGVDIIILVLVFIFMYGVYRISLNKVLRIISPPKQ